MSRNSSVNKGEQLRERRRVLFKEKRAGALASLGAKVAAVGDDALLDEFEAAAFLGCSVQTLRHRRSNGGTNPPSIKIGLAVRYRFGSIKPQAV